MDELELSQEEWEVLFTSLDYTRQHFEDYAYPSFEFRNTQIQKVDSVVSKLQELRRQSGLS